MSAVDRARLAQVEAQLDDEQVQCEAALRAALGHAIRVGDLLIEAKALIAHGAWLPWLSAHFRGSARTARAWMQLARESKTATVADLGVRAALAALAAPREEHEPSASDDAREVSGESVDAEPVPEGPSIFDRLRDAGDLADAAEELRAEDARREQVRFPQNGVERATFRQIRAAIASAERDLGVTTRHDSSTWTRAESLEAAGRALKEAGELAVELAAVLRRALRAPKR